MRKSLRLLAPITVFALASAAPAARTAASWYVAHSIGSDANICVTPSAPCKTINGAIVQAAPGDTIFVTNDIYTGLGFSEIVHVDRSLTISGGWNLNFTAHVGFTIIDGEHQQRRGIVVTPGADLDISDVAIIWCNGLDGGGMYVQGGLLGNRLFIVQNYAFRGAGIYFDGEVGDNALLFDSALYANTYSDRGGGMFINGARLIDPNDPNSLNLTALFNVTVSNNTSVESVDEEHGAPPNEGGGLYVRHAFAQLTHTTFAENTVFDGVRFFTQNGAGVGADNFSTVLFQNTLIADGCNTLVPFFTFSSQGNNVERGIGCDFGLVTDKFGVNPQIYPGTVNPGPFSTITHALAWTSPALDDANASFCIIHDARGVVRPQGLTCDTGSYERSANDPAMGFVTHPGNGFADSERCPTLRWDGQGRGLNNPCTVDPDMLVRAVLGRITVRFGGQ